MPRITAVICTYDRYGLLSGAIASSLSQTLEPSAYDVLVIDNTPDAEQSAAQALRFGDRLRWHHEPVAGLSTARNTAIRLCRTPLIAFLDDDAAADQGWLASYCASFDALGESCAAIGGRVRPRWRSARPSWLPDSLVGYLSVVDLGPELRLLSSSEWVAGANIAFRTEVLRQLGGFATALGRIGHATLLSNEEIALIDRIRAGGSLVAYDPDAVVDHLVDDRRLSQAWFRRRAAWQAVSDRLTSTAASPAATELQWDAIKEYFLSWPPADRTVRALALDVPDASRFRSQIAAVYEFVACLLDGIGEQDED